MISGLLGFSDNGVGLVFYHGFFSFFFFLVLTVDYGMLVVMSGVCSVAVVVIVVLE